MPVSRSKYRGTHLENAAQWLLEIEEMASGGWTEGIGGPRRTSGYLVAQKKAPARFGGKSSTAPARSSRAPASVPRMVRVSEPRWAPRPQSNVRAHHFEHKTILASKKGSVSVAEARGAYTLAFNAADGVIEAKVRATIAAEYIEGTTSSDAERVVYIAGTNGDTNEERVRFWALANENAHFVGEHKVRVSVTGAEAAWAKAAHDPSMPTELRATLADALKNQGSAERVVNDAGIIVRWLKGNRRFPAELRDRVELERPKNGRVAYSIIGQFPHTMSEAGMRSCLDDFGEEFSRRKIPWQAVIHEPTAKNSAKNWHFHLIYCAGPAEKLEGGRWSFEREWRRNKYRTNEWVPLKRMGRNEEVASADWVPTLKARWRDIVNKRSQDEGLEISFTNETNRARGLPKAQTRYSPGRQALHKKGFFTARDVEQILDSWADYKKRARRAAAERARKLRARYDRLSRDERPETLPPAQVDPVLDTLDACQGRLEEVEHLLQLGADATVLREMLVSGPKAAEAYYSGILTDLERKKPTPARSDKAAFANEVCAEAAECLRDLQPTMSKLSAIRADSEAEISALGKTLSAELSGAEREVETLVARAAAQSALADERLRQEGMTDRTHPVMAAARAAFLSSHPQM
jgi:hypothetical protein